MSARLTPQAEGIPLPEPDGVSAPYWESARHGRLVFQRCDGCGAVPRLPARICGGCGSRRISWLPSSGRGRLYSWTVVWRPQHPSFHVPYAPAVVAMEEEWWLLSAVVGCAPEDLSADLALHVVFHHAGGDIWLPYAAPDEAAER